MEFLGEPLVFNMHSILYGCFREANTHSCSWHYIVQQCAAYDISACNTVSCTHAAMLPCCQQRNFPKESNCARSLFSLHARFALQWCDCISEVSGLIFGHLRHLRRWLTFGLFEIFCLEACNHSDAQRGAMLHSFNCLTRAANRDVSPCFGPLRWPSLASVHAVPCLRTLFQGDLTSPDNDNIPSGNLT